MRYKERIAWFCQLYVDKNLGDMCGMVPNGVGSDWKQSLVGSSQIYWYGPLSRDFSISLFSPGAGRSLTVCLWVDRNLDQKVAPTTHGWNAKISIAHCRDCHGDHKGQKRAWVSVKWTDRATHWRLGPHQLRSSNHSRSRHCIYSNQNQFPGPKTFGERTWYTTQKLHLPPHPLQRHLPICQGHWASWMGNSWNLGGDYQTAILNWE